MFPEMGRMPVSLRWSEEETFEAPAFYKYSAPTGPGAWAGKSCKKTIAEGRRQKAEGRIITAIFYLGRAATLEVFCTSDLCW
jgi:hypothetical protein